MVKCQSFTLLATATSVIALRAEHKAGEALGNPLLCNKRRDHRFVTTLWLTVALATAVPVSGRAADATRGMVVSAQREASAAGLAILEAGGNAIDAAVAVGYALAVVDPCCGNIGGGGFMLIHRAEGGDTVINFREIAPRAATADMYLDPAGAPIREASLYGYRAVAVPGTVMGLDQALIRYGRLARAAVLAPAIALARTGFVLGEADAAIFARGAKRLAADPEAARIFLHPDGTTYRAGERLMQADLAATLERIATEGPPAFYRGAIPAAIATASAAHNGMLSETDFAAYTTPEVAPVGCVYRGYQIVAPPPPRPGGALRCENHDILSGWDIAAAGYLSPRALHLAIEAMRHGFLDRNTALGDPAFVNNPLDRLLSAEYAATLRAGIDLDRATPSAALSPGLGTAEKPQTTHYSVVDRDGNAVSVTYTLNGNFGAGVVAPGTGFLLNNEMDDFTVKAGAANLFGLVQGEANAITPGKRPLSSMAPAFVERDGRPVFVLGSPGGPRIITAVLETVMNLIDFQMPPDSAVAAPRFHHQYLPDTVFYETGGLPADTQAALAAMGYRLEVQEKWGAVELIAILPDGRLIGINDPRRPAGAALGN
jgi:gamma-glutamyltranspeptidase/glutathione hydrolase